MDASSLHGLLIPSAVYRLVERDMKHMKQHGGRKQALKLNFRVENYLSNMLTTTHNCVSLTG